MASYLIVGASSGIGDSLAHILSNNGHTVLGTYNTNTKMSSQNIEYRNFNVLEDDWSDFDLPEQLDGLVYCPGTIDLRPFSRINEESWIQDYKLQVVGAVQAIQAALPCLKKSKNASVVLFSTVAVQQGFNYHSLVSSSKGAIEGLTRSLASEFAPSIRVNAIAPSLTETAMSASLLNNDKKREANAQRHPLKRIGSPEDIAEAAHFLLDSKSSWITGQVISIDGGISGIRG